MSFFYTRAHTELLKGTIAFDGSDDIEAALLMSSTSAAGDDAAGRDAANVAAIFLDEFDGANYARKNLTELVLESTARNRATFDAGDLTWTQFGFSNNGSRQVNGMLLLQNNGGGDATSIPLVWIDSPAVFPFRANGTDFTVRFSADGVLFTADAIDDRTIAPTSVILEFDVPSVAIV